MRLKPVNFPSRIQGNALALKSKRYLTRHERYLATLAFFRACDISILLLLSDRLCKDIGRTIRATCAVPVHGVDTSNRKFWYRWTVRGYDHILAMGAHSCPLRGEPTAKIPRGVWHHRQVQHRTGSVDDAEQGDHPPTLREEPERYRAALHAARHPLLRYVLFKIDSCAFACAFTCIVGLHATSIAQPRRANVGRRLI